MIDKRTELKVSAIRNGTVIDHIPAKVGIKVLKLFDMHNSAQRVTIGLNLPSSALGSKDLLKIENVFISEAQANKLALYAPHATVNQIENYEVVKKLALQWCCVKVWLPLKKNCATTWQRVLLTSRYRAKFCCWKKFPKALQANSNALAWHKNWVLSKP